MDDERVFNEFMRITGEINQLSHYEQMMNYPRAMTLFFKSIYKDGYANGYVEGKLESELKQSKLN